MAAALDTNDAPDADNGACLVKACLGLTGVTLVFGVRLFLSCKTWFGLMENLDVAIGGA